MLSSSLFVVACGSVHEPVCLKQNKYTQVPFLSKPVHAKCQLKCLKIALRALPSKHFRGSMLLMPLASIIQDLQLSQRTGSFQDLQVLGTYSYFQLVVNTDADRARRTLISCCICQRERPKSGYDIFVIYLVGQSGIKTHHQQHQKMVQKHVQQSL